MFKKKFKALIFFVTLLFFSFLSDAKVAYAKAPPAFISVVNPVRGEEFWEIDNQTPYDGVSGQISILSKYSIPATWLIRFDALGDNKIVSHLKSLSHEKGIFLEVTPKWAQKAGVKYIQSENWHFAGSVFLTGYSPEDRKKLIDVVFDSFNRVFGYFPKSAGAWWIDSFSLEYIQKKYGVNSALIVADQFSTDNYQIWGQYWSTPYLPAKNNALIPARSLEDKLNVVIMQWAPRDPINAYGRDVANSTHSLQANDYIDYHELGIDYFNSLLNLYINQQFNEFSHLVVGLENSYPWVKYGREYDNQIRVLAEKRANGQISVVPMQVFASWYQKRFPLVSPEHIIIADDPLKTPKKVVWFMNPYYRVGWFYTDEGSVIKDLRQYTGELELCLDTACEELNFATSATRVLDNASFGDKWVIDEGKIKNFKVRKSQNNYVLSYINEAGKVRTVEFWPRDIAIDGISSSIDGSILNATTASNIKLSYDPGAQITKSNIVQILPISKLAGDILKFVLFVLLVIIVPGYLFINKLLKIDNRGSVNLFLSTAVGIVFLTLVSYIAGYLKIWWIIYLYALVCNILFISEKLYLNIAQLKKVKLDIKVAGIILLGSLFQVIPTIKSGLRFNFGLGFWGPNTHDGVWHISLINQIIQGLPAINPIYAGESIQNYHYLYNLLVASSNIVSSVPVADLIFRFYPFLLSLLLGIGTYYLGLKLFNSKMSAFLSLIFVYFAGSFGWIVEYFKEGKFGGESDFWVNQSISFNLNPPFAVSLVLVILLLHLFILIFQKRTKALAVLISLVVGLLVGFKAYAAITIFGSIALISIIRIISRRDYYYFKITIASFFIALSIYIPNFKGGDYFAFAPFWFIHSMIDSPDRVGWARLSIARVASAETGNWIKFSGVEILGLVLFIAGNLGTRIIGLGSLFFSKTEDKFIHLLCILIFTISLTIPLLLIQKGNPWNTIQFMYYALYIAALFSGAAIVYISKHLPKLIVISTIVAIFIITPINSYVTASGYFYKLPHAFISTSEFEALNYLSTLPSGIVLTVPFDKDLRKKLTEPFPLYAYGSTAYVAAYSRKSVFVEDEIQNNILQTDYKKRLLLAKEFFKNPSGKQLLSANKIKYIYILKIYTQGLNEEKLALKKIFENEEALIYENADLK